MKLKKLIGFSLTLFLIALMCKITKQQSVEQQKDIKSLGLYITTIFQQQPRNGLSFQQNLIALEAWLKLFRNSNCRPSQQKNQGVIAVILIKHSLQNNQNYYESLKSLIQKYANQLPKVQLSAVSKQLRKNYANGVKFMIPKDALNNVQHYFLIELNTIAEKLSCEFIRFHFNEYVNYFRVTKFQKDKVTDDSQYRGVTPITGFLASGYNFNNVNFTYTQQTKYYYSMLRTNAAFIPTHLMDLYFINIQQIQRLRALVRQDNGCQDIVLNFIVAHYYLQIPPLRFNIQQLKQQHIQSTTMQSYYKLLLQAQYQQQNNNINYQNFQKKSNCLLQGSRIIGYNPLKTFSSINQFGQQNWKNPGFQTIVKAKRVVFDGILQGTYKISVPDSQKNQNSQNKEILQRSFNILQEYEKKLLLKISEDNSKYNQQTDFLSPEALIEQQKALNQNTEQRIKQEAWYSISYINIIIQAFEQIVLANSKTKEKYFGLDFLLKLLLYIQICIALAISVFLWRKKKGYARVAKKASEEQERNLL